jgi:ribonucleoside-diphosphate reductase alpha chain
MFDTEFAYKIYKQKYSRNGQEEWVDTVDRVVTAVGYSYIRKYMEERVFIPGGRYLAACGNKIHNINNCFCLGVDDSREGWAELLADSAITLSLGGGIGVEYSDVRAKGSPILGTNGVASGPISLMKALDALAAHIRDGGNRRAALWAGLNWKHADVFEFISAKRRSPEELALKQRDFSYHLPLEGTNTSVTFDTEFWDAYENPNHPAHMRAKNVFREVVASAAQFADPGFSFNFQKDAYRYRNACTEFISNKSGDSCNLGTIFINKIRTKEEMAAATKNAVKFLIRGALYTNRPTEKARVVAREENRIGLGLGGIGDWLLSRRLPFEVNPELRGLLEVWAETADTEARKYALKLGLSVPANTRAIAPTGTIAILAGTTGGAEPLFCKAYLRSWWDNGVYKSCVVVDPVVKRLIESGIPQEAIYDAYDIPFEQRVKFQADLQDYVDMGISSTVNLPPWGSEGNNFFLLPEMGETIMKYSKRLRGLTLYADGAIGGQPLQRMDLEEALAKEGIIYEGTEETCKGGICGL